MMRWDSVTLLLLLLLVLYQEALTSTADTLVAVATHPIQHRHRRSSNYITQEQIPRPNIRSLHIDSVVLYRYANTAMYSKISNVADEAQEVYFVAVLPDNAFITGFAITINQVTYMASVMEKVQAKNVYEDAVTRGITAGHVALSARDSNRFIVSVNVEAYGKVSFNLTYEELLFRELGVYSLKINILTGQVVKDMFVKVRIEDNANITHLEVPDLRLTNEIIEDASVNPLAKIHRPTGNSVVIIWSPNPAQQEAISRDNVLGLLEVRYDIDRKRHPNEILMNNGYFVHFFAPENLNPLEKHVVFVLDKSTSMVGLKLMQLKFAMMSILDELSPRDAFSLILFWTEVKIWMTSGELVDVANMSSSVVAAASDENKERAKNMINKLTVEGSTNIYDALQAALQVSKQGQLLEHSHRKRQCMIIFLTDGRPTVLNYNENVILRVISTKNKEISALIHSLAFGKDADFEFLKKLSLQNSGFARKIYEGLDASLQLKNFYKMVSSPLLENVTFKYIGNEVNLNSLTRSHFPMLYKGSELAVAGHYHPMVEWDSKVISISNSREQSFPARSVVLDGGWYPERSPIIRNASEAGFMERLWAYLTIRQLLDKAEVISERSEVAKQQALKLALKYGFVTPLTSLVVTKPDAKNATTLQPAEVQNTLGFHLLYSPSRGSLDHDSTSTSFLILALVIHFFCSSY